MNRKLKKSSPILKFFSSVILFVISMNALSLRAEPLQATLNDTRDHALSYLVQAQNGDGSWGKSEEEKVRVTSAVLEAFGKYSVSGLVYRRGINWLANAEANSIDSLARQIKVLSREGINTSGKASELLNLSTQYQHERRWGAVEEYTYSAIDTALAIEALTLTNSGLDLSLELSFTDSQRNSDGPTSEAGSGWAWKKDKYTDSAKGISAVLPTARMLFTYSEIAHTTWSNSYGREAAYWLSLQQRANGAISQTDDLADIETALSTRTLGLAKDVSGAYTNVQAAYGNGLDYLVGRPLSNGSINNNLYATAEMALALFNQNQALTDTDSDGIPDSVESHIGTDPLVVDSDYLEQGNGLNPSDETGESTFHELLLGQTVLVQLDTNGGALSVVNGSIPNGLTLNPVNARLVGSPDLLGSFSFSYSTTDSNGNRLLSSALINVVDPTSDTDGDGIPASYERMYSTILSSLDANDAELDNDNDGLSNLEEYNFGSDPTNVDADDDDLADAEERTAGTDPNDSDTDSDGLNDGTEVAYASDGMNPLDGSDAQADFDQDNLNNADEISWSSEINDSDTDSDNMLDGDEVTAGRNPTVNEPVLVVIITSTLL